MKQAHFFTTTRMESSILVLVLALSLSHLASVHCYKANSFDSLKKYIVDAQRLKQASPSPRNHHVNGYSPVYLAPQEGLKLTDKIEALPGQPDGIELDHYSGYVTVDSTAGRALFYYFVESPNSSNHPLVLWLNGGPGCSSLGDGALMGLGPFRVNQDGASLSHNEHAWSNIANILFLESPAGVGFSYSNTTSDYEKSGDERTAEDSYTIGNALIDTPSQYAGLMDFLWTHALMSDEIHQGIVLNCNFSMEEKFSTACVNYILSADTGNINYDDLYAPLCNSSYSKTHPAPAFDPCSESFISSYLNSPDVQKSLHANVTGLPGPWESCSSFIGVDVWSDVKLSVLPTLKELMGTGISVWVYSGDTDHAVPVTATRYAINKLKMSVKTPWYPWYSQDEVGGFAVEYENLTFATIRGSGHLVPSYQPARGLDLFSSFLAGKLPPPAKLAS